MRPILCKLGFKNDFFWYFKILPSYDYMDIFSDLMLFAQCRCPPPHKFFLSRFVLCWVADLFFLLNYNFPNHHILSIFLLILTCKIRFENDLKGRILWYDNLAGQTQYFKIDKALKYSFSRVIDPLNALLNVYVF